MASTKSTKSAPSRRPPARRTKAAAEAEPDRSAPAATLAVTSSDPGMSEPLLTAPEAAEGAAVAVEAVGPILIPPDARAELGAGLEEPPAVTGTWRTSQYVDALWSIDQLRNAFMLVRGLGWRKLYNGKDGAFSTLLTLAAQARQTGRQITLREEPDGMVYEIYLW